MREDQINRIPGISISVGVYFVILLLCATWANRRNRKEVSVGSAQLSAGAEGPGQTQEERQYQYPITDTLSSHYLSGRSLNSVLTTGTIFASFFSGYSVVGIPNEAYQVCAPVQNLR